MLQLARHQLPVPSVFVETGSYRGDGIAKYLTCLPFKTIHSIELSNIWADHCRRRFADELGRRVHIHTGDSSTILPTLALPHDAPVLFYLDAHFSGASTAGADIENGCPVLKELAWIASRGVPGDIVFIDDMRLMGKDTLSGVEGNDMYPPTRFDFTHVSDAALRQAIGDRPIRLWSLCTDIDRLMIVFE
jgi:hypothetical protein